MGDHLPGRSQRLVADVMLRSPHVADRSTTVGEARTFFADAHVHLLLLTTRGGMGERLLGTLGRDDLPPDAPALAAEPALRHARLEGRTVRADLAADVVRRVMEEDGMRRLAVVDDVGRLRGLVCLKSSGTGFCTDAGVSARRTGRGRAGGSQDLLVRGPA